MTQDEHGGIMKYGYTEEGVSDRKKVGRINEAWILVVMALLIVVVVGCVGKQQQQVDIVLNNYPKLFEKNVIIVTGVNATNVEIEGAQTIADNLRNITGNTPVIKTDSTITEKEKAGFNLILVGRPDENSVLREVYEKTNATKVTNEFPGAGKGILEILRNPWNKDKVMLLVAGSDENGLRAAFKSYKSLTSINDSVGYIEPGKDKLVQLIKLNQSAQTLSEAEEKTKNYFFETSQGELLPNVLYYYTKGYEFNNYFIVEIREVSTFGRLERLLKIYRIEKVKKL
ncbi:MAG: hypothetical protein WCE94_04030 [Candidatus Methanoperedens sp.]